MMPWSASAPVPRRAGRVVSSQLRLPAAEASALLKKPTRGNKFKAVRVKSNGRTFDSKAEAQHYEILRLREMGGQIVALQCQPKYPLEVNGVVVCVYIADFSYFENGRPVVDEVKSKPTMTPVYRLKRKLFKILYSDILHREIVK